MASETHPNEMTIDELLDLGIRLDPQQIDFLRDPVGRLAVAVYGIPDPDRLYIAGPGDAGTIWQPAQPGQPADERGAAACVLPILVQGGNQSELCADLNRDWYECQGTEVPSVHCHSCDAEWTWTWGYDDCPMAVAVWDLWPIDPDEQHVWSTAASNAYYHSKIQQMHELADIEQGGSEYYGEEAEDLSEQMYSLINEAQKIKREVGEQSPDYLTLVDQIAKLETARDEAAVSFVNRLEAEITNPVEGCADPQLPPLDLPPEQSAVWHSLQALSWRNWRLLSKQSLHANDAPYNAEFEERNRRLSPWF